jgi:hypothetical protein
MARYERDPRATAGGPSTPDGQPKVTMRLGPDGRYAPVRPEGEATHPESRAAERPPAPLENPMPSERFPKYTGF